MRSIPVMGTAVLLTFLFQNGHAQEKKAPPEQITKLQNIVGEFEGEATVVEGGKSYVEKAMLTIDGPDSYTFSWNAKQEGKTVGSGKEKLRRASR